MEPQPPPPLEPLSWAPQLSHEGLALGDGGATAAHSGGDRPAACVCVARGGANASSGLALSVELEALPSREVPNFLSFGVGRTISTEGSCFGSADGTCGVYQSPWDPMRRRAAANNFGRRADRSASDKKLEPVIKQGSRLALHLSPRSAEGTRTARYSVDGAECAVFVDIEDDGGESDWVAGACSAELPVL